jgi:hypothetical protein
MLSTPLREDIGFMAHGGKKQGFHLRMKALSG